MKLIVTNDIYLTEFRPSDLAACLEHLNDRAIHEQTLRIPFPYTEDDFAEWMEVVNRTTRANGQPVIFAIRDRDDALIGGLGFDDVRIGKFHRAQLGYWLAKPYWSQGIMTAVVGKACDLALNEWQLVKISAHVFADNPASCRVLEKCGFVQEGYLRKHYLKDGQFRDAVLYALIRE
ncbi:MAG: GNAT family N-acetyltransferase [Gemmataceae bacterium]